MKNVNREYYFSKAPGQDDYWTKMAAPRYRVRVMMKWIRRLKPKSVADLGCGNGALLEAIARAVPLARLCGLDFSPALIEQNKRNRPEREWSLADLQKENEFPDPLRERFDLVTASEIIEHLPDPEALLVNALALARPGGRLFLSTQSGPMRETEKRVGHIRHFSADEINALLEKTGWTPVRVWNAGFPFHDFAKWGANLNPERTMRNFSERAYGPYQNLVCWAMRVAYRFNSNARGAQLFAVAKKPAGN